MAKKIRTVVKLHLAAGKAGPAYPLGPMLGQHGVNILASVREYNERTAGQVGSIIPVEITIYEDRSVSFVTKAPPTSDLLRKAAGVEKGSGRPNNGKFGSVSRDQLREIARIKLPDFNTGELDKAMKTIEETARSMGIEVV